MSVIHCGGYREIGGFGIDIFSVVDIKGRLFVLLFELEDLRTVVSIIESISPRAMNLLHRYPRRVRPNSR